MKILLIGEFSALHKNLKEGLENLGHDVDIAAMGDGWKNISRDIDLGSRHNGIFGAFHRRLKIFTKIHKLSGYDIVQFINPFCLFYYPWLTKAIILKLKRNNKKIFLSASGTDSFYLLNAEKKMEYTPIKDYLLYDYKNGKHKYSKKRFVKFNHWLASNVNGVIPIMYDYEVCYQDEGDIKLLKAIPIPMNIERIKYIPNIVGADNKIVIFHGLNRYGFKGTKYVMEAFDILKTKYGEMVELVVKGGLPLEEYLEIMERANIIIDQTSSYSYGMNAVYAMAQGKVVLTGNEKESLISLGFKNNPAINIRPDKNTIVEAIELFIQNKKLITEYSLLSRKHVEIYHDYKIVAKQYLKQWSDA